MSEQHIPAWKKINIVKQAQQNEGINENDDPLNVTTHLSTGLLSKKQKKHIINKTTSKSKENKVKKNTEKSRKKIKVKKSEREAKPRILKDQIKYLVEFYLGKINDELPETLKSVDYIANNLSLFNKKDDNGVIEVWKFSKQKQNWLLKNFFNIEEIPIEFDQLLFDYFELLNGFSKQQLIEQCQKKISNWNDYIEEQETQMQKLVEDNDNDNDNDSKETKNEQDNKHDSEKKDQLSIPPSKDEITRSKGMLQTWLNLMKKTEDIDAINKFESSLKLKNFN